VGLLLYAVVPFDGGLWPVTVVAGLVAVVAALPLAARRVARISQSASPMAEAATAVTLVASVVLVGFSAGYYALATHTEQIEGIETKIDAFYFTVVTMSTVGFGDIVPVGQGARALVAAQILLNLSALAFAVRWVLRAANERHEDVKGERTT
jgi:hypothetical protein